MKVDETDKSRWNGQKWIKVDEIEWKWIKMNESRWNGMKVGESRWKWRMWVKVVEIGWKWMKMVITDEMDKNGLREFKILEN